jgi:putative addiction module component (TIGR02574 family)
MEKRCIMITKELEMQVLSLDKPDPEIEAAWVAESERRYGAYKRGEIQGSTLDEMKKRIRLCS